MAETPLVELAQANQTAWVKYFEARHTRSPSLFVRPLLLGTVGFPLVDGTPVARGYFFEHSTNGSVTIGLSCGAPDHARNSVVYPRLFHDRF